MRHPSRCPGSRGCGERGAGPGGSLLDAVDTLAIDGGDGPGGQGLVHGVLAELRKNLELQTSDPSVRCVREKAKLAVG